MKGKITDDTKNNYRCVLWISSSVNFNFPVNFIEKYSTDLLPFFIKSHESI